MKEVNKVEEKIFVTILIKTFLYPFYKKCEMQGANIELHIQCPCQLGLIQ